MAGRARRRRSSEDEPHTTEDEFLRMYYDVFLKDRGPRKRKIKPANFDLLAAAFTGKALDEEATLDDASNPPKPKAKPKPASSNGVSRRRSSTESHKAGDLSLNAWHARQPDMCCICLDDDDDAVLLCCEGPHCEVIVHLECYALDRMPAEDETWLCDRCSSNSPDARCVLCPEPLGALKRSSVHADIWCHVVCAQWLGAPATDPGLIDVADVAPRAWAQPCVLCPPATSAAGACVSCDAGMCRSAMHVTCAQRIGLLVQDATPDMADPHFAFCKQHSGRTSFRVNPFYSWLRARPSTTVTDDSSNAQERWKKSSELAAALAMRRQLASRLERPSTPSRETPSPTPPPKSDFAVRLETLLRTLDVPDAAVVVARALEEAAGPAVNVPLGQHEVACSECAKRFDMRTLDPPMKRRPARGYTWRCTDCDPSSESEEEEDEEEEEDKEEEESPQSSPAKRTRLARRAAS